MDSTKRGSVRRRLTPDQRQLVLARYHQSKSTQRDFCAREGVGLSTLVKWLQQERGEKLPPLKFQEVILPGATSTWAFEVVSPRGWVVRCQAEPPLGRLAEMLRSLPC